MKKVLFLSFAVYLLAVLLIPAIAEEMFDDPDTYWHIATGDLIRSLGSLPENDSWSLSAGQKNWYITSWSWDVLASYICEHFGWHGIIIMNSITIAAIIAVVFAASLLRSMDGASAFIATLLAVGALMDYGIRPHHMGSLFIALLMLLLTGITQKRFSSRWLCAVPPLMLVWANIYGGFIVGLFLLAVFAIEAFMSKNWKILRMLCMTGLLSLAACLCNPTGFAFLSNLLHIPSDPSRQMIKEWQGVSFAASSYLTIAYILLFFVAVIKQRLPLSPSERWIAYVLMFMGIFWQRNLRIFAVVSAPLLALGISRMMIAKDQRKPLSSGVMLLCSVGSKLINNRKTALGMLVLELAVSVWLFSPAAASLYNISSYHPKLLDLSAEVSYLEQYAPKARLLNSYNLGGPLLLLTHGKIPVFMDGRVGTAYPVSVIKDYVDFYYAHQGSNAIFDRYHLDGTIILLSDRQMIERFVDRKGWHLAFQGKRAAIFMRDKH